MSESVLISSVVRLQGLVGTWSCNLHGTMNCISIHAMDTFLRGNRGAMSPNEPRCDCLLVGATKLDSALGAWRSSMSSLSTWVRSREESICFVVLDCKGDYEPKCALVCLIPTQWLLRLVLQRASLLLGSAKYISKAATNYPSPQASFLRSIRPQFNHVSLTSEVEIV
jgi:hypothetical protein